MVAYTFELQQALRRRLQPRAHTIRNTIHDRIDPRHLTPDMPNSSNLDKRLVEALKLRVLELRIVKAEEVVHDDVTGEGWEGVGEVQRLLAGLELLQADGEGVDVPVDDVDEVEDGAAGEPGWLLVKRC